MVYGCARAFLCMCQRPRGGGGEKLGRILKSLRNKLEKWPQLAYLNLLQPRAFLGFPPASLCLLPAASVALPVSSFANSPSKFLHSTPYMMTPFHSIPRAQDVTPFHCSPLPYSVSQHSQAGRPADRVFQLLLKCATKRWRIP